MHHKQASLCIFTPCLSFAIRICDCWSLIALFLPPVCCAWIGLQRLRGGEQPPAECFFNFIFFFVIIILHLFWTESCSSIKWKLLELRSSAGCWGCLYGDPGNECCCSVGFGQEKTLHSVQVTQATLFAILQPFTPSLQLHDDYLSLLGLICFNDRIDLFIFCYAFSWRKEKKI